ncbi:hypothetical protein [Capnocytophaga leadbetteri]|jgi:hypothetical protein|uniref:hypothetical protein n=1 Tax=Capnocytophaga leadbetteri TaxID=327575 RepID=UPI00204AE0CF|nr:hypothetical protein [Capnocytophaga leadbetteri]DAP97110.1 MAG TPA: tail protein [Caudoviricetes sp.]
MGSSYLNINIRITVAGKIQFNAVKQIEIAKSIELLTSTAKVELPREFKNTRKDRQSFSIERKNLLELIKVGDSIHIEAGYNGDYFTEFEGYITQIGADIPLLLTCEDEMCQLKNKPLINKTYASVSLKQLLKDIAPDYETEVLDMQLGKLMIERSSPYKVLEELKKQYGVHCSFRGKKLIAGLKIDFKSKVIHHFIFDKNFRQSKDLKYKTKNERKVLLKAESSQKGTSKKVTYQYGEEGGGERTLHAPTNLTLEELKAFTEKTYNSSVFDGYEGTLEGFGYPRTQVGDTVALTDPNYPDKHRDGLYLLESVTILLNAQDGFKRKSKLSMKLSNTNSTDTTELWNKPLQPQLLP